MTAILGADLGERRVGLAIAEDGLVRPLQTIRRRKSVEDDARLLAGLASEHRAVELIVGLPLELDGHEGAQALLTREWASRIAELTGLRLTYRDERWTSIRAGQLMERARRGRHGDSPTAHQRANRRARVDRLAAAILLQDELDARSGRDDMTGLVRPGEPPGHRTEAG